jgi:hypothetical protein
MPFVCLLYIEARTLTPYVRPWPQGRFDQASITAAR